MYSGKAYKTREGNMENVQSFLQDVQDLYSSIIDLSILILDTNAKFITHPSHKNRLSIKLAELEQEKQGYLKEKLYFFKQIQKTSIVDGTSESFAGLKFILVPISLGGSVSYFIVVGPFVESLEVKSIITNKYSEQCNETGYLEMIDELKIVDQIELDKVIRELNKLSSICKEAFLSYLRNNIETKLYNMNNIIDHHPQINESELQFIVQEISTILKGESNNKSFATDVQLFGFAEATKDKEFEVAFVDGDHSDKLKGVTFSIGEGFLGQAITFSNCMLWEELEKDPRSYFFTKHGIVLSQLLCIPIRYREQVYGMIFLGLNKQTIIPNYYLKHFMLLANRMGKKIHIGKLEKENTILNQKITISREVTMITSRHIEEYIRLQSILDLFRDYLDLEDIGLTYNNHQSIKYVTRNKWMSQEQLYKVYMESKSNSKNLRRDNYIVSDIGELTSIEIPMYIDDEIIGVLVCYSKESFTDQIIDLLRFCCDVTKDICNIEWGKKQKVVLDEQPILCTNPEVVAKEVISKLSNIKPAIESLPLTMREKEVLYLVLEGLNNQEVAEELYISTHTVKNHITNIYKKIKVQDRSQAFALVYRIKFNE